MCLVFMPFTRLRAPQNEFLFTDKIKSWYEH